MSSLFLLPDLFRFLCFCFGFVDFCNCLLLLRSSSSGASLDMLRGRWMEEFGGFCFCCDSGLRCRWFKTLGWGDC